MNQAIKLAIEKGGYVADIGWQETTYQGFNERNRIVLDPEFWKALGKALGWGKSELWENDINIPHWKLHALRFFELKLTGGDEEKFWSDLLQDN